jgi:uncharacterized protein HemX
MNQTSPTLPPVQPVPRQRPKWPRRIGFALAVVVALGAGVGIGTASNSQQSQLNAASAMIARDRTTISQLQGTAASLREDQLNTNSQQLAAAQS